MRDEDDAPIKALDAISERCHGLKVEVVGGLVQHEDVRLDVPDEDAMYRMTEAIRGHQESITGNQSSTYETAARATRERCPPDKPYAGTVCFTVGTPIRSRCERSSVSCAAEPSPGNWTRQRRRVRQQGSSAQG